MNSRSYFSIYTLAVSLVGFVGSSCSRPAENNVLYTPTPVENPNGRNDAWDFAGAGGGGATFYPAVSPHNSDVAFLSCDMTGSYCTKNGGLSWRMFNLRGVTRFYVFDPLDSNVVYANANGLFKSTDGGNSWTLLYPVPEDVTGIVAKGDHAEEVIVTRDSTEHHILALAIDPQNSAKLFAAIQVKTTIAFYTSGDGGRHWTKEKELEDGARNIYVVPDSPSENRTIYVTGKKSITERRNGAWKINKGPSGVERLTEFASGFDKEKKAFIIYAISGKSYFDSDGGPSGIHFTADGGATWQNRESGLVSKAVKNAPLPEWRTIATSAQHPEVIYVSYGNLKVHKDTTAIGVAKSGDYGMSWKLVWEDKLVKGGDISAVNLDGGWINDRFGPSWGENPFSIGVSPVNPDVCYTTDFGRVIRTKNGGKSWSQVYSNSQPGGDWVSRGLEVTTGYSVVFDPFNDSHLFSATTDIGLMESNDGGKSWRSASKNNGIPKAWANSTYWLAFDPEVKGKAWAVMSGTHDLPRPKMWRRKGIAGFKGGILETEDSGKSWRPVSAQIGEAAMTHILVDPASSKASRTLYACAFGKGVYKSMDGGISWKQKNNGIAVKEPFAWRITRRESDSALFLVMSRRGEDGNIGNEMDGALYRSKNGAETWEKISLPPGTNAPTSLVVDPDHPGRLVLSAWGRVTPGRFSPDTGGGIFLSEDDGKSWTPVLLQDQHIHDITYDPRIKTFYACGFTGSAYRSIDLKTWQRIQGYNFKWGKRVEIDPRDPEKIFIITFGGGVWYGPASGDSAAPEDIVNPVAVH